MSGVELSDQAKKILKKVSLDGEGKLVEPNTGILNAKYIPTTQKGEPLLPENYTNKDRAFYEEAVNELLQANLLKDISKRDCRIYKITAEGYRVSERLTEY